MPSWSDSSSDSSDTSDDEVVTQRLSQNMKRSLSIDTINNNVGGGGKKAKRPALDDIDDSPAPATADLLKRLKRNFPAKSELVLTNMIKRHGQRQDAFEHISRLMR